MLSISALTPPKDDSERSQHLESPQLGGPFMCFEGLNLREGPRDQSEEGRWSKADQ